MHLLRLATRILAIGAALVLLAITTVTLLAPQAVIDMIMPLTEASPIIRLLLVVMIYGAIIGALYLRFRYLPPAHGGLVVRGSRGETTVSTNSVRDRVLKVVNEIDGVETAKVKIRSAWGRAEIDLRLQMSEAHFDVPEKHKEISRALEQVVVKQLGLRMAGRPNVSLSLSGVEPEPSFVVEPEQSSTSATPRGIGAFFNRLRNREDTAAPATPAATPVPPPSVMVDTPPVSPPPVATEEPRPTSNPASELPSMDVPDQELDVETTSTDIPPSDADTEGTNASVSVETPDSTTETESQSDSVEADTPLPDHADGDGEDDPDDDWDDFLKTVGLTPDKGESQEDDKQ